MNLENTPLQPLLRLGYFLAKTYHPNALRKRSIGWFLGHIVTLYMLSVVTLGIIWSFEPRIFDVQKHALQTAAGDEKKMVPGYIFTTTLMGIAQTLLDKPGGYLTNDMLPPGVYLDNIPNWEWGVIQELRESVRALRNDFSRAQSQSPEDPNLVLADAQFHFNPNSWILPSTEEEYRRGIEALRTYANSLSERRRFFARADNLNMYLGVISQRLGSLAHRLSANVRELRYVATAAGDMLIPEGEITETTPWLEIDDIFFEARGYIWALIHVFKAIEIDFRDVLESRRARESFSRIIIKLKNTQQMVWSPLILNNSGFGIMTNHSLVIASYISRANSAIIELRVLLQQG